LINSGPRSSACSDVDRPGTGDRDQGIEFREELPKSGAGKILKRILAEEEKSAGAGIRDLEPNLEHRREGVR
jgi:acyl-CoA synthetase (AMP-forming)/AMP-acid ligase II